MNKQTATKIANALIAQAPAKATLDKATLLNCLKPSASGLFFFHQRPSGWSFEQLEGYTEEEGLTCDQWWSDGAQRGKATTFVAACTADLGYTPHIGESVIVSDGETMFKAVYGGKKAGKVRLVIDDGDVRIMPEDEAWMASILMYAKGDNILTAEIAEELRPLCDDLTRLADPLVEHGLTYLDLFVYVTTPAEKVAQTLVAKKLKPHGLLNAEGQPNFKVIPFLLGEDVSTPAPKAKPAVEPEAEAPAPKAKTPAKKAPAKAVEPEAEAPAPKAKATPKAKKTA